MFESVPYPAMHKIMMVCVFIINKMKYLSNERCLRDFSS